MTANEILSKISELNITNEDFANEDWRDEFVEFVGNYKRVDQGGGEDEGSHIYYVFHFTDHDVYIRIDGYYQSHYGSDWDNDPYEVRPKQKTITVYE